MIKSNMRTVIQPVLIVLGITAGLYFSIKSTGMHAAAHMNNDFHTSMKHSQLNISSDSIIPEIITLEVTKDSMSGWNLFFKTTHFQFSPENASSKHICGQGHAHLLINGDKVARLYSNWFHIPELEYRINELEVSLNSNTHAVLAIDGNPISRKINNNKLVDLNMTVCNK